MTCALCHSAKILQSRLLNVFKIRRKLTTAPNALDGSVIDVVAPVQTAIVQALAWAFAWVDMMENGLSIDDLVDRIDVGAAYVRRIIKLTALAPDIVMCLLNGEEPDGLSLARLVKAFRVDWQEQRRVFGFGG